MPLTYSLEETILRFVASSTLEKKNKMDVYKRFATDTKKENEGTWIDIGEGARLLVARAGNRKYGRLLESKLTKHQRALDLKDEAAEKLSEQIMIEVLAESVLLGFEGLDFQGETLTYSLESAKKALSVKDFRGYVSQLAGDIERFRVAQEEALGNS
jgi:hypothetical protein